MALSSFLPFSQPPPRYVWWVSGGLGIKAQWKRVFSGGNISYSSKQFYNFRSQFQYLRGDVSLNGGGSLRYHLEGLRIPMRYLCLNAALSVVHVGR